MTCEQNIDQAADDRQLTDWSCGLIEGIDRLAERCCSTQHEKRSVNDVIEGFMVRTTTAMNDQSLNLKQSINQAMVHCALSIVPQ